MVQLGVKNDIAKLQQLLGSKLYSNKYSFIAEALQNSTDAMRKCGKPNESFKLGLCRKGDDWLFYIRDYGCSFESIEDFKRLIGTLLESSKTQVKDSSEGQELGKYGIGSIAVAAYQKEWHYKVFKNGKGFDAKLQEIEGKGLFMTCGEYYDSDKKDGVYLEVKVKNLNEFVENMFLKAKYFQNIKFVFDANVINELRWSYDREFLTLINEKFTIYKSDDFQFSTLNKSKNLHICIDQYSYDINWGVLGIKEIEFPFALRFNLNDFETNPTREVLVVGEDYKEKIIGKIKLLAEWLIDKYNEENPVFECTSLGQYREELKKRAFKTLKVGGETFNILEICAEYIEHKTFNLPTFKDITQTVYTDFMKFMYKNWSYFYKAKGRVSRGAMSRPSSLSLKENNCFLVEKSIKKGEQKWFKEQSRANNAEYYFFGDTEVPFVFSKAEAGITRAISYENYKELVLSETDQSIIDSQYKPDFEKMKFLFDEFKKSVFLRIKDVIPVDYIMTAPKKKCSGSAVTKLQRSEEEVILKYPRQPLKYSAQWSAMWEDKLIKIKNLSKLPKLHIYGQESSRKDLEVLYDNFRNYNLQTIMVTEKIEKILKEESPHNFIHIYDMKKRFGIMSNYITMSYIDFKLKPYQGVLNNTAIIKEFISTSIGEDLEKLNEMSQKFNVEDVFSNNSEESKGFLAEIVKFYIDNPKMYNQEMLFKYKKALPAIEKLDFVPVLADTINRRNSSYGNEKGELALKVLRDLSRAKQVRMNWQNYTLDKVTDYFETKILETV